MRVILRLSPPRVISSDRTQRRARGKGHDISYFQAKACNSKDHNVFLLLGFREFRFLEFSSAIFTGKIYHLLGTIL